jgi:hypothetical protein
MNDFMMFTSARPGASIDATAVSSLVVWGPRLSGRFSGLARS